MNEPWTRPGVVWLLDARRIDKFSDPDILAQEIVEI
jgi:hypothetical protein